MGCVFFIVCVVLIFLVYVITGSVLLTIIAWSGVGVTLIYISAKEKRTANDTKRYAKRLLKQLTKEAGLDDGYAIELNPQKIDQVCLIEFFQNQRYFAILNYFHKPRNARFRVYHFNDLCSWVSHVTRSKEQSFFLLNILESINVELQVRTTNSLGMSQVVTETLTLLHSNTAKHLCTTELAQLKDIQNRLKLIKPESES